MTTGTTPVSRATTATAAWWRRSLPASQRTSTASSATRRCPPRSAATVTAFSGMVSWRGSDGVKNGVLKEVCYSGCVELGVL